MTARHSSTGASGARSLIRNSGFLMATTAATSLLGYVYWAIAARTYPRQSIGLASGLIGAWALIAYGAGLGIGSVFIQVLPKLVESNQQWNAFLGSAMSASVSAAAAVSGVIGWLMGGYWTHFSVLRQPMMLALFVFGTMTTVLSSAVDATFISLRRSDGQFARNATFAATKIPLLLAPVALLDVRSPYAILASWDASLLIALVLARFVLMPRIRPGLRLRPQSPLPYLKQWRLIAGYQLTGLGAMLPTFAFPTIVVALVGSAENATFYFTWSVGAAFFMVSSMVAQALFAEGSNRAHLGESVRLAVKVIAVLATPVMLVCFLWPEAVLSIFGREYANEGSALLRICVVSAIPDAITNIYVAVLQTQRRVWEAARLNLVMAAISLVGAAVALPSMGINAVGWSWLAAQSTGSLLVCWALLRGRVASNPPRTAKPILSVSCPGDDEVGRAASIAATPPTS